MACCGLTCLLLRATRSCEHSHRSNVPQPSVSRAAAGPCTITRTCVHPRATTMCTLGPWAAPCGGIATCIPEPLARHTHSLPWVPGLPLAAGLPLASPSRLLAIPTPCPGSLGCRLRRDCHLHPRAACSPYPLPALGPWAAACGGIATCIPEPLAHHTPSLPWVPGLPLAVGLPLASLSHLLTLSTPCPWSRHLHTPRS
jgi:hypothetical protein